MGCGEEFWNKEAYAIRRMLTETSGPGLGPFALSSSVSMPMRRQAVSCLRDLFQGDDGGWLEDPVLLDRLVSEKLLAVKPRRWHPRAGSGRGGDRPALWLQPRSAASGR